MKNLVITLKNIPLELQIMLTCAFKSAPTQCIGKQIEIPEEGLTIDWQEVTEPSWREEMIKAAHDLIIGASYIIVKNTPDEEQ